ncbi:hypothetical protein TWF696_000548 [Orbilia brochopaga]|uniref:Uncharacterized protein n=1 Tax=Orbilia brochopaga TaxID=3140254 RepID=A0AAV9VE99_9PEZI
MLLKALLIGSSFAHVALANKCDADNCLRALRATQIPTRLAQAQADCSSYFAIPTVTYTETLTFSETESATTVVTETSIVELTVTTVVEDTSTTTLDLGTTATVTTLVPIKKRQNAAPPAYAPACTGTRLASACLCISVSSPTVTPSTTITVSTTLSFSTTQTDIETETISTVVATETSTDLDIVTKTIGAVATTTIKPFRIKASFDTNPANDKYLYPFARFGGTNPIYYTGFADTLAAGATYILDGTTIKLLSTGAVLSCQTNIDWAWVYGQAYSGNSAPCVCNIDPTTKVITITGGQNSVLAQWDLRMTIAKSVQSMWGAYRLVTSLKAIAAV